MDRDWVKAGGIAGVVAALCHPMVTTQLLPRSVGRYVAFVFPLSGPAARLLWHGAGEHPVAALEALLREAGLEVRLESARETARSGRGSAVMP